MANAINENMRVRRALGRRFQAPAWAMLEEVANGTGARARRRADAVAISCYPSRGLEIHGVEIKVARSDWLRELKAPNKSEPVQKYCDRWWVAAPKGVVDVEELPPTWGLLELRKGGKLNAKRQAPQLDPEPLDRGFLAALARAMHQNIDCAQQRVMNNLQGEGEYDKGFEAGRVAGKLGAERELAREYADAKRAQAALKQFEEASGLTINRFRGRFIGGKMRQLLAGGTYAPLVGDYKRLQSLLQRNLQIVEAELQGFEETERFLHADDEEWERRLHAATAHPGYEYRSVRAAALPLGDGWEPNDDFDPELHAFVMDGVRHWRRPMKVTAEGAPDGD